MSFQDICASSGVMIGGDFVKVTRGVVYGVLVTPAAADATVSIRDTDGSGTILATFLVKANLNSEMFQIPNGVQCPNAIYAELGGAGATAVVFYQ